MPSGNRSPAPGPRQSGPCVPQRCSQRASRSRRSPGGERSSALAAAAAPRRGVRACPDSTRDEYCRGPTAAERCLCPLEKQRAWQGSCRTARGHISALFLLSPPQPFPQMCGILPKSWAEGTPPLSPGKGFRLCAGPRGCVCPAARGNPGMRPCGGRGGSDTAPSTAGRAPGGIFVGDLYNPWKAREREGGKPSRLGRGQNPRREGEFSFVSRDLYLAKVIIGKISLRTSVSIGFFFSFFSFSYFLFLFFFFLSCSTSSRKFSTAQVVRVSIPRPESH